MQPDIAFANGTKNYQNLSNNDGERNSSTFHHKFYSSNSNEPSVMYMQDYSVLNDKMEIGLCAVCTIAALTEPNHNKNSITEYTLLHQWAKSHFSPGFIPNLTAKLMDNGDRYGFLVNTAPIDWAIQKFLATNLHQVFYINRITQARWSALVKDVCTNLCWENFVCHIWRKKFIQLSSILATVPEVWQILIYCATINCFHQAADWNFSRLSSWTQSSTWSM